MTATTYRSLLAELDPKPIHSQKEYQRALAQLERLMVPRPGKARSLMIEVLSTLIEKYEEEKFPTPDASPAETLAQLLKAKNVRPAAIARGTGIPPATLSNVLANRRGISKQNAAKLGRYFNVSPVVFLPRIGSAE